MDRVFDLAWRGAAARTPDRVRRAGRPGRRARPRDRQGHRRGPPRRGPRRERAGRRRPRGLPVPGPAAGGTLGGEHPCRGRRRHRRHRLLLLPDRRRGARRRRRRTATRRRPVAVGTVAGRRVAFLPRHGRHHDFPPHRINYRANLWALGSLGVRQVLAPCAVGGLSAVVAPGDLVVPDQLVDRTAGRASSTSRRAPRTSRSPTPTARASPRPSWPPTPTSPAAAPWW